VGVHTTGLGPADEGRHAAGDGPWWAERWFFGWSTATGGGFAELVLFPNQRVSWYRSAFVVVGQPLLVVVDHEASLPRVGLTLRAHELWADHVVEAPFTQWTVANETRALSVDDPDVVVGQGYGDVVPIAFDLEWYAAGTARAVADGYEQDGEIDGVVELGGGVHAPVTARSTRSHTWGPLRLPAVGPGLAATDVLGRVPDRWPAPFAVIVDDVLTTEGWRRERR
jgi:hypothetical protein